MFSWTSRCYSVHVLKDIRDEEEFSGCFVKSVCHVPSKVLNILANCGAQKRAYGNLTSAILRNNVMCMYLVDLRSQSRIFVVNYERIGEKRRLVDGSWFAKIKDTLMTDLSWLSESRSPGVRLLLFTMAANTAELHQSISTIEPRLNHIQALSARFIAYSFISLFIPDNAC